MKEQHLQLVYHGEVIRQDIDMDKLRPRQSYDYLMKHRNGSLQQLLDNEEELQKFLHKRNCPACGKDAFSPVHKKDSFHLVQCDCCRVIYVNPILDVKKYQEVYKAAEYQQIMKGLGEDSHLYRLQRFGRERLDVIEKYHDGALPRRLLDVGCSTGFVVEEAKNRGWDALGIELNPSAAAFAKKRGLQVFQQPLEELEVKQQFTVIALYDVLEHLAEPARILEKVYALLAEGGKIYIYVPNYASASKDLMGLQHAHFIWPTHHLTYFTPETLKDFLERFGFTVFYWETQGLDMADWLWYLKNKTDYDTWIIEEHVELFQFYINAAGHGKNLRMYAQKGSP